MTKETTDPGREEWQNAPYIIFYSNEAFFDSATKHILLYILYKDR